MLKDSVWKPREPRVGGHAVHWKVLQGVAILEQTVAVMSTSSKLCYFVNALQNYWPTSSVHFHQKLPDFRAENKLHGMSSSS